MTPVRPRYLSEGAFRTVYALLNADTDEDTGRVLKVDNQVSYDKFPIWYPWDSGGCDAEVRTYEAVRSQAPHLLHHFATIHDHGPGWLIQERIRVGTTTSAQVREADYALRRAGIYVFDIGGNNIGLRPSTLHPVFVDYANARLN